MHTLTTKAGSFWLAAFLVSVIAFPLGGRAHERESFNPHLLVETGWLEAYLEHPDLRVLDFGRTFEDYSDGHIPCAVFVDRSWIAAGVGGVPGMLAHPERVIEVLEAAGVGNESTVIVYDDGGGLWASRLFWVMEYLGHGRVRLLDGGWNLWVKEGREASTDAPLISRGRFVPRIQADRLATKDWILENMDSPHVLLLDVRSVDEYTGEDVRAERGGHIPGAVNLDWILNLTDDAAVFISPGELRALYEEAGVTYDREAVTYCQGGVRASHTYFVLRLTGHSKVRVYDASWAEWGDDPEVPIVEGASEE